MPVFEWDLDLQASEWDWREAAGPLPDMYDVSEDFWRKFEELPDLGDDLESLLESTVCNSDPSNVLRHHDCMWAGMCLSKEHKNLVVGTLPPPPPPPPPPPAPIVRQPTVTTTVTTTTTTTTNNTVVSKTNITEKPKREPRRKGVIVQKTVGRSLLISSRTRMPEPTRPETPPSLSESEEDEKKTVPVVPVSEVTNQVSVRRQIQQQPLHQTTNLNVQFDHNYDKSVRLDDLGVQTPSDSEEEEEEEEEDDDDEEEEEEEEEDVDEEEDYEERIDEDSEEEEEIDVVSLNNTVGTVRMRNQPNSLPYNPSRELRRELQDTVASAITTNKLLAASRTVNRRLNNGPGRRKRKRADSDEEDDSNTLMQQQQQQQALLNSRVMPSSGSVSGSTYNPTTTPRYHHPHHRRTWRRTTVTSTSTSTSKKSRFSTDSETDSEKRSLHNNMERMRRIGLRNAFEDLRVLIPSLKESKRAAKVNILKDSAVYVRHLTVQERSLAQKVMSLHHDQEKLRSRLSKLRRSLAAHR